MKRLLFVGVVLFACSLARGQNKQGPDSNFVLKDGTPVRLRLRRTVSTADSHVGDTVDFDVLQDVMVSTTPVIQKEALAFGTVEETQPRRTMARGGKLKIRIEYVTLHDGEKAHLRAVQGGKGGSHARAMTVGIVAAGLLFFPAAPPFLLMHGKDMVIHKGAEVTAYVDNDVKLDFRNFPTSANSTTLSSATTDRAESNGSNSEELSGGTLPPGYFQNNTYANERLGLFYPLPPKWISETDLIRKQLFSKGEPEAANLLLAAVYIPQDLTELRRDSSLMVFALPRSEHVNSDGCREYLDSLIMKLRTTKTADQRGEASEYSVAGHDFSRVNMEYRSGTSDRAIICSATKEYLLLWKIEGSLWHSVDEAASTIYAIVPWPPDRKRELSDQVARFTVPPNAAVNLIIRKTLPIYPAAARENHVQGRLRLRTTINEAGDVVNLELLDGPIELTASAVVAVRQWKYRPYLLSGKAVPISTEIVLNYDLAPGVSPGF